jgi:hypothetical protein
VNRLRRLTVGVSEAQWPGETSRVYACEYVGPGRQLNSITKEVVEAARENLTVDSRCQLREIWRSFAIIEFMESFTITSSPLSIARELWRLGEPGLASRAASLSAEQAVDIGIRAGALGQSGEARAIWPDGPRGVTSALVLAAVEYLEGSMRPCSRRRRLPEKNLPPALQASEADLWAALTPVADALDRQRLETRE